MTTLSVLIATLVGDAVDGVRAATTEADARRQELLAALDEEPAALVDDAVVDDVLRDRCPPLAHPPTGLLSGAFDDDGLSTFRSNWQGSETAVRPGNVYLDPECGDHLEGEEFPPIRREFDVDVPAGELDDRGDLRLLTPAAVDRVRTAIATRIGRRRRDAIRGAADRGLPVPWVRTVDAELPATFSVDGDALGAEPFTAEEPANPPESVGRLSITLGFGRE